VGTRRILAEAQFDHLLGQRIGLRLDGLDLLHQLLFYGIGGGLREHRLHRRRRVSIQLRQALDLRHLPASERGISSTDGVAHGNRAVVHAATEVDRIALFQTSLRADLTHAPVDDVDFERADHGDRHHQRQNHEKSQTQAHGNRHLLVHRTLPLRGCSAANRSVIEDPDTFAPSQNLYNIMSL